MKNLIFKAVAIGAAAGLCGVIACSDDSSSCGSTNSNNNNNTSAITMTCGDGTHLEGTQCVNDTSSTNTNTTVTTISD